MTPTTIREQIDSASAGIKEALRKDVIRADDMDQAWLQVSRKVGNRIAAGEIAVKLKKHRL
jgi:uncharacterized phage-like protein YoqJ